MVLSSWQSHCESSPGSFDYSYQPISITSVSIQCGPENSHPFYFTAVSTNVNPLIATLKPQSNGPSYSNTVIGTLGCYIWYSEEGAGRGRSPPRPINGQ